jgi:hypothetical protein
MRGRQSNIEYIEFTRNLVHVRLADRVWVMSAGPRRIDSGWDLPT